MKLRNIEIVNANQALGELVEEKMRGKIKFRLFKLKSVLEDKHKVVAETLKEVEDEQEQQEILLEEQEVGTDVVLTEDDLEPLPMNLKQLVSLKPFIEEEQKGEDTDE